MDGRTDGGMDGWMKLQIIFECRRYASTHCCKHSRETSSLVNRFRGFHKGLIRVLWCSVQTCSDMSGLSEDLCCWGYDGLRI